MPREIGALIGDYRLLKSIGSGAAGDVFQAEHVITRRVEAIKFPAHDTAAGSDAERALLREIQIQASLRHPNIATVHNAFRTADGLALVMEFVDGEPLSNILARGRPPLRDGARYVLQTLDALAFAHAHGVVHRDVKPSNIIVAADGSIKLTDFGLALPMDDGSTAGSGTLAGSPYYISPEQVVGLDLPDARSDCYSAGVILYEIATGARPFEGGAFEVMLQHREAAPAPPMQATPRIGASLNAVILKAMEKDPARRFQSAREFGVALERALATPFSAQGYVRWIAAAAIAGIAATAAVLAPIRHRPAVHPQPLSAPVTAPAPPPQPVPSEPEAPVPSAEPDPAPAVRPINPAKAPVTKRASANRLPPGSPTTLPIIVPAESEAPPVAKRAAPAAVPVAKTAAPEPPPVFQLGAPPAVADIELPTAPLPEPTKRRSLLRRAFGRIVHPLGKPEPQPAKRPQD